MKVELIALTQPVNQLPQNIPYNPSIVVEQSASVCYDSKPTKNFRIMKSCVESKHLSVLECISFTFHISEIDRNVLAQLSRHRHISLSVRSQRYCREDNFNVVVPKFKDEESELLFSEAVTCSKNKYLQLIKNGEAPEDARSVLPGSCYTELYMTANARTLIEMSHLRLCNRAQLPIRTMFYMIKDEVDRYCPEVADYMVPMCESHKVPFCEEGKSCGRHPKLEELLKPKVDNMSDGECKL